jgi:chaperonin GroEL
MYAARAAVEEGIVPGGVALVRWISALEKIKADEGETTGVNIVKRALEEPVRQIAQNAGFQGTVAVGRIRESKGDNFGFNADHCDPEGRHPGVVRCMGQEPFFGISLRE